MVEAMSRATWGVPELSARPVLVPLDDAFLDLGLTQLGMAAADVVSHHLLGRLTQLEGDLHALGNVRVEHGDLEGFHTGIIANGPVDQRLSTDAFIAWVRSHPLLIGLLEHGPIVIEAGSRSLEPSARQRVRSPRIGSNEHLHGDADPHGRDHLAWRKGATTDPKAHTKSDLSLR